MDFSFTKFSDYTWVSYVLLNDFHFFNNLDQTQMALNVAFSLCLIQFETAINAATYQSIQDQLTANTEMKISLYS